MEPSTPRSATAFHAGATVSTADATSAVPAGRGAARHGASGEPHRHRTHFGGRPRKRIVRSEVSGDLARARAAEGQAGEARGLNSMGRACEGHACRESSCTPCVLALVEGTGPAKAMHAGRAVARRACSRLSRGPGLQRPCRWVTSCTPCVLELVEGTGPAKAMHAGRAAAHRACSRSSRRPGLRRPCRQGGQLHAVRARARRGGGACEGHAGRVSRASAMARAREGVPVLARGHRATDRTREACGARNGSALGAWQGVRKRAQASAAGVPARSAKRER
jgi:hypothetical protein